MAIIQSLPIATSKVIAANFKATETNSKQLQVMDTGKHFYTSDTDAWLQIGISDIDLTGTQADLTLVNTSEGSSGSVITQIVDVVSYQGINTFLFDFSKEITVNGVTDTPILHAGKWIGQAYLKKAGENITACTFKFNVEGHILDQKESALVAVQNVNTLVNTLDGMITDLQEDVDLIQAAEQLRIALYNEIQEKYLNGDFVGAQGVPGTPADTTRIFPSPVDMPTLTGADGFIVAYDEINNVFYLKKDDGGGGEVVSSVVLYDFVLDSVNETVTDIVII